MATNFEIVTHHATPNGMGGFQIDLNIRRDPWPVPVKKFGAQTPAEALLVLHSHREEVAKLGQPLGVFLDLARGERAPRGWKAIPQHKLLLPVNVPGVEG